MNRWHIEFSAGGDGCLPEHVDVYDDKRKAELAFRMLANAADHDEQEIPGTVSLCFCNFDGCDWCRDAGLLDSQMG